MAEIPKALELSIDTSNAVAIFRRLTRQTAAGTYDDVQSMVRRWIGHGRTETPAGLPLRVLGSNAYSVLVDVDNWLEARRASLVPRGTEHDSDAPAVPENAEKHAGAGDSIPTADTDASQIGDEQRPGMAGLHSVHIRMGGAPTETVLELDGRPFPSPVERFTLTAHAGQRGPATLTVVRFTSYEEAAFRGVAVGAGDAPRVADVYETDAGASIDISGAVHVVEESARASLKYGDRSALHAFVIRFDDDRTGSLAELVDAAERYHAIRRTLEDGAAQLDPTGDGPCVRNGAELDVAADLARAAYHDGPRQPT